MTLEERIERLERDVFGKAWEPEPKHPHQWEDVYQFGGHYPDGKRCKACQLFDLQGTPAECIALSPPRV